MDFDGADDFVIRSVDIFGGSHGEHSIFIVSKEEGKKNSNIFTFRGNSGRFSSHNPWADGNIFFDLVG